MYGLTKMGYCWLFRQVRMVLKYLQMLMVCGFCVPLKFVQLMPPGFFLGLLQRYAVLSDVSSVSFCQELQLSEEEENHK